MFEGRSITLLQSAEKVNLLEALGRVGSVSNGVSLARILVIRVTPGKGPTVVRDVKFSDLYKKADLSVNIPLETGDIVFIPKSAVARVTDWVNAINPFLTFISNAALYSTIIRSGIHKMAQIDVNLRDLYRVIRKRKWIVLFAPILMGLLTYLMVEVPAPIYTAQALVKITKNSTVAGLMTQVVAYSAYDNMATQVMVIRSRPVLEDVAVKMKMVKPGEDAESAFEDLRGRVDAQQQNSSDILAISGIAGKPDEAILLANTLVDAYIERFDLDRDKSILSTLELITRRDNEAKAALNDAEKALFDFKREEGSKLSPGPNLSYDLEQKQIQYNRSIADLNATLDSAQRILESKDFDAFLLSYFTIDDAVARQMFDRATQGATAWSDVRNARNKLLEYQTPDAPQVVANGAALKNEEDRTVRALNTLRTRLKADVDETNRLLANTQDQQKLIAQQPELTTQLDNLTLEVKDKQEKEAALHKQLEDAEIQAHEKGEEITVVERARTASTQVNPGRAYKSLIGALIGVLIGGVFSFVLEAMDTSLGTIEDVEQHINSVVLGIIPHLEKEDIKDRMKIDKGPTLSAEEMDRFARLVTHFDPKSIGSEAYRTLRTNIASIMVKTGGKVILVSSSMIQEGKTTSCCNIATAFAQGGKRTLLIDADLRRPTVDKTFGIVRVPGLTDLLLDTRDPRECYRTIDDVMLGKYGLKLAQATPGLEYLTILPAGRIVDKPTELLTSPALDKLLEDVRQKFDVIVIDVSPVLPVADAFVMAPKVDGIILTYQIGRVARDVLKRTKIRMESVGGKVWGVILNDIQSEIDYRSGDFSYYHYRYDKNLDEPKTIVDRLKAAVMPGSSTQSKQPEKITKVFEGKQQASQFADRSQRAIRLR